MTVEHRDLDVGGVRLHVALQGEGPPVVLLHGFPEFWYSWRHQMSALAAAGFQAIAPDLRGYHRSDKPAGVAAYRMERLVDDVAGLASALGVPRVHLVGHDWGGAIAFCAAAWRPDLVDRLVVLNAPHPRRMLRRLLAPSQLARSWYMFFFQLPWLPERMVRRPEFARRAFRGWARHPERFPDDVIERFAEALARPGAATAAIHYYRAAARWPPARLPRIERPTLVIWGEDDRALGPELLDGLDRHVADLRVVRLDASHWVQQDAPDEVNAALLAFLRG